MRILGASGKLVSLDAPKPELDYMLSAIADVFEDATLPLTFTKGEPQSASHLSSVGAGRPVVPAGAYPFEDRHLAREAHQTRAPNVMQTIR